MRTIFTSDINEIGLDEGRWNDIVSNNETNTIFQTYQWFQSWWNVFGDQNELFFISVWDGDEIVGFAPLMISTDHSGSRVLMFIGEGKSDYCDFIIARSKEEVLKRIFDTIYLKGGMWDRIYLNNIPGDSSTVSILSERVEHLRNRIMINKNIICPTLIINGDRASINKITSRKHLKRRFNYLNNHGNLTFRNIRDREDAEKNLEIFMDQHVERWDEKKIPSLFMDAKNRQFYKELTSKMIDTGWLFFSVLEYNDDPVAFHYGFDYNSRITWYKPSFNINFSKRSPGIVLIKYLIEYTINNNRDELDFTLGDEPFKDRFTNHKKRNAQIMIFKSKCGLLMNLAKYRFKNMIKRSAVWNK